MADGLRLVRAANLLDSVQTDAVEFLDLNNKLAILCVLASEKTAFGLGLGENAFPRETIEGLGGFARRYDLRWKMTDQPTKPAQREPGVPVYFVKELDRMSLMSHAPNVFWLYCEDRVGDRIDSAVEGAEDVGHLLGYPDCCVRVNADSEMAAVRRFFEEFIRQHRPRDQAEAIRLIREDVSVEDHGYFEFATRNVGRTVEKFPFVFHTACDACLKSESSATRELNERYRAIAEQAGAYFYRRFLEARPS